MKAILTATLLSLILLSQGCISTGPIPVPSDYKNEERRIAVITNIENNPIYIVTGITIFGNKRGTLESLPMEFEAYLLGTLESKLQEMGYDADVIDNPSRDEIAADLYSGDADRQAKAYEAIRTLGYDDLILIGQGMVRAGLRAESGPWIQRHGIWKFPVKTFVVVPLRLSLWNAKEGELIARPRGIGDGHYYAEPVSLSTDLEENGSLNNEDVIQVVRAYQQKIDWLYADQIRDLGL